jgi:hypothetical protein
METILEPPHIPLPASLINHALSVIGVGEGLKRFRYLLLIPEEMCTSHLIKKV